MSVVQLKSAKKRYGATQVIHGVDLTVDSGEFCVFVGPSGCGKSTLLRMIAGLEETSDGQIFIGKRDVTRVDASERGIAMVFQAYALYPHMTVRDNIGFGLKMNGVARAEITRKVDEVAAILQLQDYMDRKPKALSGGQRQRVAIGRALVRGPQVFLFDEPLSNLDAELRVDMRVEIARLHQEIGATMIYVTHDQVEAMTLADKIVVLRAGIVEQIGDPIALYSDPDNKFVAGFIGSPSMNFLNGRIGDDGAVDIPALGDCGLKAPKGVPKGAGARDVVVGLRPEHIEIVKGKGFKADIIERLGGVSFVHALAETGEKLVIEQKGSSDLAQGADLAVRVAAKDVYFFDANTEERLR